MNKLQYKLNNYIYKIRTNNQFDVDKYVSSCYDKFIEKINNLPIYITREELEIIIRQIYDVLKFKLTTEEIMQSMDSYLHFLGLTVTISQVNIDKDWCIDKIIYLSWNISREITKKIDDSIPFIKERLYNTFELKKGEKSKTKTLKRYSNSY